ncbi:hypothetical protein AWB75_05248 [Caballeronia catudaia]|uniref:Uncharacterized protein n=1 Tax=Caballeronia catudaia TaxID=1777136 RepID=A0A158CJE6_9BURK|nr:hypothetical protein AWB75_05248 [Caballeronia catudaia]
MPAYPALSILRRNPGRSMTPSPIMPRSINMSFVSACQSETWYAKMRPARPAAVMDARSNGSHQQWYTSIAMPSIEGSSGAMRSHIASA